MTDTQTTDQPTTEDDVPEVAQINLMVTVRVTPEDAQRLGLPTGPYCTADDVSAILLEALEDAGQMRGDPTGILVAADTLGLMAPGSFSAYAEISTETSLVQKEMAKANERGDRHRGAIVGLSHQVILDAKALRPADIRQHVPALYWAAWAQEQARLQAFYSLVALNDLIEDGEETGALASLTQRILNEAEHLSGGATGLALMAQDWDDGTTPPTTAELADQIAERARQTLTDLLGEDAAAAVEEGGPVPPTAAADGMAAQQPEPGNGGPISI